MATISELLDGHVTLEVECLDRLYLNGYIGKLATGLGLSMFMRDQLGKPVPSPVVLGQVSERFRQAVKELAELLTRTGLQSPGAETMLETAAGTTSIRSQFAMPVKRSERVRSRRVTTCHSGRPKTPRRRIRNPEQTDGLIYHDQVANQLERQSCRPQERGGTFMGEDDIKWIPINELKGKKGPTNSSIRRTWSLMFVLP